MNEDKIKVFYHHLYDTLILLGGGTRVANLAKYPEEINYEAIHEENSKFLKERGWIEVENKWTKDEKRLEIFDAVDEAENHLVKEKFEYFTLSTTCPEMDEEFNKSNSQDDSVWDRWIYFIHPKSYRVYSYTEAVEIARYRNMEDIPLELCSGRTRGIQKIMDGYLIVRQPGMTLFADFVYEGGEDPFYRFNKVVYNPQCARVTTQPVMLDGKLIYQKVPHPLRGDCCIQCTKCGTKWCCMECAIENDAMDHKSYDKIDRKIDKIKEQEGKFPKFFDIVCCHCSGKKRSWEDRD